MFVYLVSVKQILKFHERVISALILVASFARPKISSQFLRASESFKICKDSLTKFVNFFLLKKARKVSNFTSQASNFGGYEAAFKICENALLNF